MITFHDIGSKEGHIMAGVRCLSGHSSVQCSDTGPGGVHSAGTGFVLAGTGKRTATKVCGDNSTSSTFCNRQMIKVVENPFNKMIKFIRFYNKIIGSIF